MEPAAGKEPSRSRRTLQWKILGVLALGALLPLLVGGGLVIWEVNLLRQRAARTARTYERRAEAIARRVARLLKRAEADLRELAGLPRTVEAYTRFANRHQAQVWIRSGSDEHPGEQRLRVPLYKEVAFADKDGQEKLLVVRGRAVGRESLRQVSDPARTTYRCERYSEMAMKQPPGEIYVSHLNGFHINKIDALAVEKTITRLKHASRRQRLVYRYLLYEMLRAAGEVEYVNSFVEGDHTVLVYRRPADRARLLVEQPADLSAEQLRARNLELQELLNRLAPEDTVEGKRYDGVIRLATAVADRDGRVLGVVSLALDHLHLAEIVQHVKAMEADAVVFAGYRDADYTYIYDDEGWIITHPKAWNIRGVDGRGRPVPPYTENTTASERLVGRTPVNLLRLDWKMGQGYHQIVLETRQGHTGIATSKNLGGVLRTRLYTPIFYATGAYSRHGIFGGVMMGTRVDKFIELLRRLGEQMSGHTGGIFQVVAATLLGTLLVILLLSVLAVRRLVRPIRALTRAARQIGAGQLDTEVPACGEDEIGQLADSFREMTASLRQTIAELEHSNQELQQAQRKLLKAEREKRNRLEQQVQQLQQEVAQASFSNMVAESPAMQKVKQEIVRVAASSATVLILGENGTGKELVAEAIHRNSPRRQKPFLRVNCAAFNENLLESELFGHTKGSYTGATAARQGLFAAADGGTLLLDEVGDMSPAMQKKLLRTLQEGEVVPVGSNRVLKVDVRILAATNRDLQALMKEGQFREDLYHRLNVITIRIPPLRERRQDIMPLAGHFLKRYSDKENKPALRFSAEAEKLLLQYHWPGNVRELENAVERAVIRCLGEVITAEDFQLSCDDGELPAELDGSEGQTLSLEEVERRYILAVLEKNDGNKKETARQLGIGYNTLWRKLKKYGRQ
ncbi:MAG: hypothetical protein DRI34_04125 [Deltaproteobacteria bacterium]|nr:MAG: hypothetical protein DRI34_04125 [Deltaproteobacteria bacterium]